MQEDALLAQHSATFRAIGATVVPELAHADDAAWREVEATVERALASRPPKLRRQLRLLLRMIAVLGQARFGRPLAQVEPVRRERFLLALQHAPFRLIRRGIWGIRTLVLMGHYTRPQVMQAAGYRADARGWTARREIDTQPAPGIDAQ